MQRKFLKNLVLLVVLNLLVKPFWILGIDRTVQNTVGPEDYGFYFAIFNFSFLFYIVLDFGITNFNNKNIAQNNQLMQKHLSNIIVLKFILFIAYLILTLGGALFINYSREQIIVLVFLGINQFLVSFILYLRSNLSGLHLFKTDSFISVLDRVLMIAICSLLLWGNVVGDFKIQYFIYAQTVSYLISAIFILIIVISKMDSGFLKLRWNIPFFLLIIKQSFPFALLALLMAFHNRIDSVMLERMLDDGARYVGIYASAYRLLDASNMFAYLFAVLLLPIFARMLKQKESVDKLIRLSYTLLIIPAIIIAVGSHFYSNEIMHLLYDIHAGETLLDFELRIQQSSDVFGLLMITFCAISTMYVFSTLLTANGSLKYLNCIAFGGMILNVILNLLLIPGYQAYGSAIATLFTQFLTAGLQIVVVLYIFKLKVNYTLILKLALYLIGVYFINLGSKLLPFDWYISFLIMIAVSILLAIFTRLLEPRNLIQIFKYGEKG
jgi:O-antigen/teichoic acid export membrane protein